MRPMQQMRHGLHKKKSHGMTRATAMLRILLGVTTKVFGDLKINQLFYGNKIEEL